MALVSQHYFATDTESLLQVGTEHKLVAKAQESNGDADKVECCDHGWGGCVLCMLRVGRAEG